LLTIIENLEETTMEDWQKPIHAGEFLADELKEVGMSPGAFACRIGVPSNRIYHILNGKRGITADTALRLGKFFGTTARYWLNLQKDYETELALLDMGDGLDMIIPFAGAAGAGRDKPGLPEGEGRAV
jgi:addiction module HigA family antidote